MSTDPAEKRARSATDALVDAAVGRDPLPDRATFLIRAWHPDTDAAHFRDCADVHLLWWSDGATYPGAPGWVQRAVKIGCQHGDIEFRWWTPTPKPPARRGGANRGGTDGQ